jgi:hypothetical protein
VPLVLDEPDGISMRDWYKREDRFTHIEGRNQLYPSFEINGPGAEFKDAFQLLCLMKFG